MLLSDFDFALPPELIAQRPANIGHEARLFNGWGPQPQHQTIWDLTHILPRHSLIIINETRVIPAFLTAKRLRGMHIADISINLLHEKEQNQWLCFIKGIKKCQIGDELMVAPQFTAILREKHPDGTANIAFQCADGQFWPLLMQYGQMPLPPYIKTRNDAQDRQRYQTIFANQLGSVAAPTAGLHFTPQLVQALGERQCQFARVLLHVGAGTFKPIQVENINDHQMHHEWGQITNETAQLINQARAEGRFILVVGTTACRLLETASDDNGVIQPFAGQTNIFMKPGYRFKFTNHLMTNFHLPQSSLFILVSALIGLEPARQMMAIAVREKYRFFSFGDACLLKKS